MSRLGGGARSITKRSSALQCVVTLPSGTHTHIQFETSRLAQSYPDSTETQYGLGELLESLLENISREADWKRKPITRLVRIGRHPIARDVKGTVCLGLHRQRTAGLEIDQPLSKTHYFLMTLDTARDGQKAGPVTARKPKLCMRIKIARLC